MKRVNFEGPGDSPDEYYFECPDCEGTGEVDIPVWDERTQDAAEGLFYKGTCPGCDGSGFIEGDADDVDD